MIDCKASRRIAILLATVSSFCLIALLCPAARGQAKGTPDEPKQAVDATTLRGKILCGYQGWFRCPGDPAGEGWRHWSRDDKRITAESLTFEMWPDMAEADADERYPAPGFTNPDGTPAQLFSSASAKTVLRHFRWMQEYGIDGAMLQHFAVDLPGGPAEKLYPSRRMVMDHVIAAAEKTGRAWAIAYDVAGMPKNKIYDVVTADWKKMVDGGVTGGPRYLHNGKKPVVQLWGFFRRSDGNAMSPEIAGKLIEFFKSPGKYQAYFVGGGDWDWRQSPEWSEVILRLDGYMPWNVGNYATDAAGVRHASLGWCADDKRACEAQDVCWLPVIYPGFSWNNLKRLPAARSTIPRRGGEFYWEQFRELTKLHVDTVYIAMFDEVDEGTAIFKVTSDAPQPRQFLTYEGLPSDWYLRLTREGGKLLRGERADGPMPKK